MAKEATKIKIIQKGADLIHTGGFNNTGINEILEAASVAKGSFYFYFKSKDDFGMQLIDYYLNYNRAKVEKYLNNPGLSPVQRLKDFFNDYKRYFLKAGCTRGCPFGNLSQEMSDTNETFRKKLQKSFSELESSIKQCLAEAQKAKEISRSLDVEILSNFIINSWEGSLITMKLEKSIEPLNIFEHMVFDVILKV
jgi:TetR/AcrR family transcriptional repressor of nem operon